MTTGSDATYRDDGSALVTRPFLGRLAALSFTFWIPLGVLVLLVVAALFAPLPYDPRVPGDSIMQAPSSEHWFGTDRSGFDVFSRTLESAKVDLPVSIIGAVLAMVIGVPIGLAAGKPSRVSRLTMRAVDMFQAFPLLVLAITLVALMGNNISNIVFAIVMVEVPRFIRLVYAQSVSLREEPFVKAVEAFGAGSRRIVFAHLLPNMSATVIAQAALAAAHAVVVVAALSFLGIGVSPPQASWGAMIKTGSQSMVSGQWWVFVFPGLAVFITVTCFNLIADRLMAVGQARRG